MSTPEQKAAGTIWIHYRFTSPQQQVREFQVHLDPETLGLIVQDHAVYPNWTSLTYHQCPNCPLRPETTPRCPVAANLLDVVEAFKDALSYEPNDIEIVTANRTYTKHVPLQIGLSSLVGIYMVTSGCPVLDKLRPMVSSHLPFASRQETTFRAIAMYLLAQFFRRQHGHEPDWEFEGLVKIYEDIITVNRSFHERMQDVHVADAGLNALVQLDCYAQITNRLLLKKNLGDIERLFRMYLHG